jgi:hypothetical protein
MDNTWLRTRNVATAAFIFAILTLAKTQSYYGSIYYGWDAQFYYSLAHSIVFDGDADITNNLKLSPRPAPFDPDGDGSWRRAPRAEDGRIASKYPAGLSMIEVPLLYVAHASRLVLPASLGSTQPHGFTTFEIWVVAVGLCALVVAGLALLHSVLCDEFGPAAAAFGVAAAWLGTSLFFYTAVFPFMAHGAAFSLIGVAMWLVHNESRWSIDRWITKLGMVTALLFLVRPQHGLLAACLAIYVFLRVRSRQERWIRGVAMAAAAWCAAIATHVLVIYTQFGRLSASGYSLNDEGFSWLAPRLDIVLVSASRGLFVFSPVVLIAAFALLMFRRHIQAWSLPFLANAALQIYLIAAWSSPFQGDAFGARMWADNAAVVAIGVALAVHNAEVRLRSAVMIATAAACGWTMWLLRGYVAMHN